jgi:hypothetical protein
MIGLNREDGLQEAFCFMPGSAPEQVLNLRKEGWHVDIGFQTHPIPSG